MEYSPPPLFKQGASARAKVAIFALIAIVLLVVDGRTNTLAVLRQFTGAVLYPLQAAALAPRDALYAVGGYFSSIATLQRENTGLRTEQTRNALALQENQYLVAENAHLRRLLSASERLPVKSVLSEMLYDTRDPFTRKIVLNRGSQHGVALGQPVIDDSGVVGQVTRLYPFTTEVTLLTDKDQAISVQVVRSGVRSVAYGRGQSGVLELRFIAANADIKKGDVLVTSGIDGVYPGGLAVATVLSVEHKSSDAFARIICQPTAGIDRHRQFLILLNEQKALPRPAPPEETKKEKAPKKRLKEVGKDAAAATPPATTAVPAAKAAKAASPATAPAATVPAAKAARAALPAAAPAAAPAARTAGAAPSTAAPAAAEAGAPARNVTRVSAPAPAHLAEARK
jgi:rod shape-determining protein MreC